MDKTTLIYYTDDKLSEPLCSKVLNTLKSYGLPIVEEHNLVDERSHLQQFSNILRGLEKAQTEYVALTEHDCFYPREHFEFRPQYNDTFYYNINHWFADLNNQDYIKPNYIRKALSGLVCNRNLLLEAIRQRLTFLRSGGKIKRGILGACEFGVIDGFKSDVFSTEIPYVDVRHKNNFSGYRKGKNRVKELPHWGSVKDLIEG